MDAAFLLTVGSFLLRLGVCQRRLTLILLQKYRDTLDTNGRSIMIHVGGVYTTFCQEEGILLQKYRDRMGRCIAILFKSIGVRGRCDSPDYSGAFLLTVDNFSFFAYFYLQLELFCLQWESASNEGLKGL